ncbi:MAG TPA: DUF1579 family protein [Thermoanaerobaculia bacterium]|nr:DUF1579 family protein [Thermoanaerobaculia bacterium]
MKRLIPTMVLVLVATVAMANQHDENAPDMLRQLDPLVGKWQCKGMAYATPWFPEHPTVGEVSQEWILDGKWLAYTYAEKTTAENPTPFTATGYFGYDPEAKMLVVGGVDSTGGYATGASKGWKNDVLTFEGPWHIGGTTANARDTFTKNGSNEVTHLGELEYEGKWVKLGQETCTRK